MALKRRNLLMASGLVLLALVLAGLAIALAPQPIRPPLPVPNGYDDLVKASGMVTGKVAEYGTLDRETLAALVATNAEALRLLRVGLSRQCLMPLGPVLTNDMARIAELTGLKRLAQALAAEGRLMELEDRPEDAARSYTDIVRYGNELSRGGFLITRLVGIATESIGCSGLAKVLPKLNCQPARVAAAELENVDVHRVTWPDVLKNERLFNRRFRFNPLLRVVGWWQSRQSIGKSEIRHNLVVAHERLLELELGLRCYESTTGAAAGQLADLCTNYLSSVPLDPFTGKAFIYHPQGTNWLLYSLGPDGADDGGRPATLTWPIKGDIRFDSR